jgi:hypothetical protein
VGVCTFGVLVGVGAGVESIVTSGDDVGAAGDKSVVVSMAVEWLIVVWAVELAKRSSCF